MDHVSGYCSIIPDACIHADRSELVVHSEAGA
jgi:hypothetical protein